MSSEVVGVANFHVDDGLLAEKSKSCEVTKNIQLKSNSALVQKIMSQTVPHLDQRGISPGDLLQGADARGVDDPLAGGRELLLRKRRLPAAGLLEEGQQPLEHAPVAVHHHRKLVVNHLRRPRRPGAKRSNRTHLAFARRLPELTLLLAAFGDDLRSSQ